jgi:hypothetical protein
MHDAPAEGNFCNNIGKDNKFANCGGL